MEPDRPIYVYCLRDPVSGMVGYVGSGTDPKGRAGSHFAERLWGQSMMAQWIRGVFNQGVKPSVQILEVVTQATRAEAEDRWLEKFRAEGHPIMNRPGKVRRTWRTDSPAPHVTRDRKRQANG